MSLIRSGYTKSHILSLPFNVKLATALGQSDKACLARLVITLTVP